MDDHTPLIGTVSTVNGPISGVRTKSENIHSFRGIPYAKPPVGELRWRPPQKPNNWAEVLPANQFGMPCWQPHSENAFVWSRGVFERSEDCLYLNVWTDSSISKSKPVMVWFHGGGHTSGWGHGEIFDGTRLAEQGVVVVTINYRLGPWGFLAHPELTEESEQNSSGNYGLLDKIASLEWVKENIEQFGGDPNNVTIFGQSAGSISVCALMASPLAKGLFHKAIGQSAACLGPFDFDPDGLERGTDLIERTGAENLNQMRKLSNDQILKAATNSKWNAKSKITVDGWVLEEPPIKTFMAGQQADVPLIAGSMANEGYLLFPLVEELSLDQFDKELTKIYGEKLLSQFKDLYHIELSRSPGLALREIYTDQFMAYSMRQWANFNTQKEQPTFLYFMEHVPPAFQIYLADSPELSLPQGPRSAGAYHSGDLAFVFNNVGKIGLDWEPRDYELAKSISKYWTNFAKFGDPNGIDTVNWPTFTDSDNHTQVFDWPIRTVKGVKKEKLDLIGKRNEDSET
mgnify:CR=1 FL=1